MQVVLAALLVSALAEPISYNGLPFATTYQAVPGATSLTTYAAGVPIAVAPGTNRTLKYLSNGQGKVKPGMVF